MQRAWEQASGGRARSSRPWASQGSASRACATSLNCSASARGWCWRRSPCRTARRIPYLPLIELLQHYFQLTPQDDDRRRREQVTGKVLTLDRRLEDTLPYLLALVGVAEATAQLAQINPQLRRRRTFEALTRLLLRESLNQPVLLLVEDLHWLDSETQAWLQLFSDRVATAQMLLLVNYRPEYQHPWGSKTYYTQLRLDPLGPEDAQALLTALLGSDPALQPAAAFYSGEDRGQSLLHGGNGADPGGPGGAAPRSAGGVHLAAPVTPSALAALQLPPTVQGVLAARIDRLPADVKTLLQTLAVLGKEFAWSLLTAVAGQPDEELQRLLAHLQAEEFLYEQPAFPEPAYTFKHALTQEVAYNAVLLERRRVVHERAAQAIEGLFAERLPEHYNALAHHYSRSGNTAKAVDYLHRAGQQAVERSAYAEAVSHLTTALDLLTTLPETRERSQQELGVQMTLGMALRATKGFGGPGSGTGCTPAPASCVSRWGSRRSSSACCGDSGGVIALRGEYQTMQALGEQLLSLAQRLQDPDLLLEAHHALWTSLVLWRRAGRRPGASGTGHDGSMTRSGTAPMPRSTAGTTLGCVAACARRTSLWLLGYPDQAVASSQAALALAQQLAHPLSLAMALHWAAVLHHLRREAPLTQARAEAAMTIATDQGFPQQLAQATPLRGWALAASGHREGGHSADPAGPGRLSGDGGDKGPTVSPGPARRGVRPGGADRRGAGGAGRGAGNGGQERGALVGSGAASAQGRTAVAARGGTARRGGSLLPAGPRRGPPPAGQIAGAAGGDEPEPAVAAAGQAGRSSRAAGADLWLVHRGL